MASSSPKRVFLHMPNYNTKADQGKIINHLLIIYFLIMSSSIYRCKEACGLGLKLFANSRIAWPKKWRLLWGKLPLYSRVWIAPMACWNWHSTFSMGILPAKQMGGNVTLPESLCVQGAHNCGEIPFQGAASTYAAQQINVWLTCLQMALMNM